MTYTFINVLSIGRAKSRNIAALALFIVNWPFKRLGSVIPLKFNLIFFGLKGC